MPTPSTSNQPKTHQSYSAELEEQIRRRAYEIYEERSLAGTDGRDVDDWLQAEAELTGTKIKKMAA